MRILLLLLITCVILIVYAHLNIARNRKNALLEIDKTLKTMYNWYDDHTLQLNKTMLREEINELKEIRANIAKSFLSVNSLTYYFDKESEYLNINRYANES